MNVLPRILTAALALLPWLAAPALADRADFAQSPSFEGLFMAYEKGWFEFQSPEGKMGRISTRNMLRLVLDEPLPVYLELDGQDKTLDVVFLGYEGGAIRFRGQENDERSVLLRRVKRITVGFRTARVMQAAEVATLVSSGEEVDLGASIEQGHPSIVHFHDRRHSHSVRMADYLSRFVVMSKGRIRYLKIETAGLNTPVARQHGIQALPAIWFYDSQGNEVQRLQGAVTTRAVDEALARADGAPGQERL